MKGIWKRLKEYEWLGKQWKPLKPTRKETGSIAMWLCFLVVINYSRGIRDVRHLSKTKVGSGHNQKPMKSKHLCFPTHPH